MVMIEYPNLSEFDEMKVDQAIWKFMLGYLPETNFDRILSMSLSYVRNILLPQNTECLELTKEECEFYNEIICQIEN